MNENNEGLPSIQASGRSHPPDWAVKQRYLMDLMNDAAVDYVDRYTRPDGTLIWRKEWPGMDGSDDGYESFLTFPLLYILGGGEHLHELARQQWNAVTWQFTGYGQVYREYDAYYDWMHHGESSTYIYYLGMANPDHFVDRTRALRFAAMYMGEDPEAPNWDDEHKLIRSPINGSKGPCLEMTAEDWVTHRPILANYLSPYEDVPGFDHQNPLTKLDWKDDKIFGEILKRMNARMVPGDVPLNLNSTSLITSAFMYTGEEKYKKWVLEYLEAWQERTRKNNGIMPDNVGPHGIIGERMDGKWWGGYYGWRWPHGAWTLLEATMISGSNALLMTGDTSWLDLHRSQNDVLWSKRREENGRIQVPFRHGEVGWFDYRTQQPRHYIHTHFLSQRQQDWDRIDERFPNRETWYKGSPRFGKSGHFGPERWFGYIAGENPDYPKQVLEDTYTCMQQRLDKMDNDDWENLETWDVHHWQDLNPVVPEGLIQMAMGTPAAIYHGGLLHASVRYFDPQFNRPGLPDHVAALVESIDHDRIVVNLVNIDPLAGHEVIIQAGGFGEHNFTNVRVLNTATADHPSAIDGRYLHVSLGSWTQVKLELGIERYVNQPTYTFPPGF
ncbi:MAG: hypothetical protein P1S60_07920 [Anaerolineae bacterium]|nr:hypothetical protein [Anaerolineae bacterium]